LKDSGDKLGSERGAIEAAVADLKKALESNDAAAMNRAMDALTQAQHKAAEALYRQQAAGAGAGSAPGGDGGGAAGGAPRSDAGQQGDVIDAEVVDEEKK
jgi:molecular chaperone DnaK